ncbi:hypothetical protein Tco_0465420 [Tanacetum coccineum]
MAALQYKDDHNRIAYLGRERGSEDFTDILSYLDHSPLRYALTHDPPVVFDSLVKQFWATASVRPNAAGSHDLVATIDGREVVVTESLIRAQLQLDDANGIFDMQSDDIFAGMGAIGYPTDRTLTFLKHHLSPQWRFLVHTILHCMSPKAGSWNQFPSSIATALVCLSTGNTFTPLHLAIAADGDAAAPHSPLFSLLGESTPERQPETEWVVPNPVSPGTDWRPWPSVPAPRPPTPPTQTPRPYDFVDPALEEPVIFGPLPRPATYIEPEDIDNLISMEDDTILGGFHEESPAGPDDAPTPTADAAGRAEDPALLTSLSAKLDRCTGRIDSLEIELGTSKKFMGGAILTLLLPRRDVDIHDAVDLEGLSRMASEALGHDQATVPSEDMEEHEEEEVPLRRKEFTVYSTCQDEFNTSAMCQFHAPLSTDVLPQRISLNLLSTGQRFEEEQQLRGWFNQLHAEDLALQRAYLCFCSTRTELDAHIAAYDRNGLVDLIEASWVQILIGTELVGSDVNEETFIERITAIKERKKRALADLRYRALKERR